MEEEKEIKCVICGNPSVKIVTVVKGLTKQMFGIEDGKVPVCKKCGEEELFTLIRCSL